jgi:hypothetical protein
MKNETPEQRSERYEREEQARKVRQVIIEAREDQNWINAQKLHELQLEDAAHVQKHRDNIDRCNEIWALAVERNAAAQERIAAALEKIANPLKEVAQ